MTTVCLSEPYPPETSPVGALADLLADSGLTPTQRAYLGAFQTELCSPAGELWRAITIRRMLADYVRAEAGLDFSTRGRL